eukprot:XP_025014519.1 jacalin-related lectin 3-like [Ricinus communis]
MDLHVTCAVPMLFKVDVKKLIITMGPWGGTGNKWDDGIYSTVRCLLIDYGEAIVSLRIEYDNEGHSKWGAKQGAKSTFNIEGTGLVDLHYPNEYLTSVHGYIDNLYETECVRSLTFQSNKKTYGPFGVEQGRYFSSPKTERYKIVGFHGMDGLFYLHALGIYLKPI